MRKIIIIFFIFCISTITFSATKSEYYNINKQVWKNKNWKRGILNMKKALADYPDEPNFYSNYSYFLQNDKQYKTAYIFTKKVYGKFPGHKSVKEAYQSSIFWYGSDLKNKKNLKSSYQILKTGNKMFPEYKWILYHYADVLFRLKKYDDAIGRNGFAAVLYLRLVYFPFTAMNFGMGLTKVKFSDYFFGTGLGIIVGTFIFTYLIGTLKDVWASGNWSQLLSFSVFFSVSLFVFSLFIPKIVKKFT